MDINAPILEHDTDGAQIPKEKFFSQGKKQFWRFDEIKKKKIDKCLLFFPRNFDDLSEVYGGCKAIYEFKSATIRCPIFLYEDKVLIALCPPGGPASACLIEELSYVGITKFIGLGSCGCIDPRMKEDDLIIPTSAIRDEGLSYHYLPASREVETSEVVNKAIEKALAKHGFKTKREKVWTIDAFYRETPERLARRREEGAVAVEMECASIAAVMKHKGGMFGQLLYFSDTIQKGEWKLRVYDKIKLRTELTFACIDALCLLK